MRDAELFQAKLGKIDGGLEVGTALVEIVKQKAIARPPSPPIEDSASESMLADNDDPQGDNDGAGEQNDPNDESPTNGDTSSS